MQGIDHAIADAIVDIVNESGKDGVPSGYIYAAVMVLGLTIAAFNRLMEGLVSSGKLTKRGDCYFPAPANETTVRQ